jgi:hypothetical protein
VRLQWGRRKKKKGKKIVASSNPRRLVQHTNQQLAGVGFRDAKYNAIVSPVATP